MAPVMPEVTGSLTAELHRFELLLFARFPEALSSMRDGLDDGGIQRLNELVTPYRITSDVETLYRWRSGGSAIFGGWRLRDLDDLAKWRSFAISDLRYPPVWLTLFDDHGPGFVELATDDGPTSPAVWWAYSHDDGVYLLFDSLAAFIATCSDLIEADRFVQTPADRIGFAGDGLEGIEGEPHRLDRSPTAYRRSDPPMGSFLSGGADHTWPESWLESVGLSAAVRRLRGPSHTIHQAISESAASQVEATIVVRPVGPSSTSRAWNIFGVSDGTGELTVHADERTIGYFPAARGLEIDIVIHHGAQPSGSGRWRPPSISVYARAIREIVDD